MNKILRVEEVKHPLELGKSYLVPCIIRELGAKMYITPVINRTLSIKYRCDLQRQNFEI